MNVHRQKYPARFCKFFVHVIYLVSNFGTHSVNPLHVVLLCLPYKQVQEAAFKLQNKSENRSLHLKLLRQAFSQGTALIDAFIR